jgi:hypothetical protein
MSVELIVDPHASGGLPIKTIGVMLWTTGADPQLLDAQTFVSPADLRAWLKGTTARYGPGNISVRWSPRLRAAPPVAGVVAACLAVQVPGE